MPLNPTTPEDWKRIEDAVKLLYIAVNKLVSASDEITIEEQARPPAGHWT